MVPLSRSYTTAYQTATVSIALFCTIFETLTVNNIITLKSRSGVSRGDWKWHHPIDRIEFFSTFHSNCCPVLYHFREKATYWSKITIFHTSSIGPYSTFGGPRRNIAITLWYGKTGMVGLTDVERRLRIMFNLVSIHCMNVTDGGTLYDIRGRAMHSVAQKKIRMAP